MLFYNLHLITTLLDLQPGGWWDVGAFFSTMLPSSLARSSGSVLFIHVAVEIPRPADEQHGHESQSIVVVAFIYFFNLIFSTF